MLPLPRLGVKTWCGGVASEDARLFGCDAFAATTDYAKLLREAIRHFVGLRGRARDPAGSLVLCVPRNREGSLVVHHPGALTPPWGRDGFTNV